MEDTDTDRQRSSTSAVRKPISSQITLGDSNLLRKSYTRLFLLSCLVTILGLLQISRDTYQPVTGDAPHYLVVAHSLAQDKDLELSNDYRALFEGRLQNEQHSWVGRHGERYPAHELGLPLVIAIPYLIAGTEGVAVWLLFLNILLAVNVYLLANGIAPRGAFLSSVIAVTTAPIFLYSLQFYPEIVAALAITYTIRVLLNDGPVSHRKLILSGISIGALPWFNLRFTLVSALLVIMCLAMKAGRMAERVTLLLPVIVSALFTMIHRYVLFGSPFRHQSWVWARTPGLLGILMDAQHGLLVYSPVYIAGIAGLVVLWKSHRRAAICVSATVAAVVLPISFWHIWWGGWCPQPGRFLVSIMPLVVPGIAALLGNLQMFGKVSVVGLWAISMVLPAWFIVDPTIAFAGRLLTSLESYDKIGVLRLLPDLVDNSSGVGMLQPIGRWWDAALISGIGILIFTSLYVRAAGKGPTSAKVEEGGNIC